MYGHNPGKLYEDVPSLISIITNSTGVSLDFYNSVKLLGEVFIKLLTAEITEGS